MGVMHERIGHTQGECGRGSYMRGGIGGCTQHARGWGYTAH